MKFNIKKLADRLIMLIILIMPVIVQISCNDEWKGEQYIKYVSFVNSGYTDTYLNTATPDGVVHYQIPVEVSGSTVNSQNVTVTIEIDPDTLLDYNLATYFSRQDLYYLQLDEQHYSFPNGMTTVIPAGESTGTIDIDFKINNLDLVNQYILPLKITSTSDYTISPIKYYKKSLMHIIPFNNFSGTYSATAANITASGISDPITVESREMRYVSDSTVFFYAGLCVENASDRANYKVRAQFNSDNTLTLTADNPNIQLTPILKSVNNNGDTISRCVWTVNETMDALQPYLLVRTITMDIKYTYMDISNPSYSVLYTVDGYYTLERRKNTQIPDENQQDIFIW